MSGIAALFFLNGREVADHEIRAMTESMRHRGPDGLNSSVFGSAALGHCMLHTTPESLREEFPVQGDASRCVLTADARIDNRQELCSQLGLDRSATDADLILASYERWGEECPKHLLGDFVFAIWDADREMLFCARDHLGIKPLYYYYQADLIFTCSTEIKALLRIEDVPEVLNETKIADYLAGMREDMEGTIYKDILKLPPAHAVSVTKNQLRSWRYYTLAPATNVPDMDDEGYAQRFRELFEEAVRCRVRSAFPVGSQLSGGLDSSYVTCVARDLLTQEGRAPLHTYSLEFPQTPLSDETEYVRAVVDQGGIEPHYVDGDRVGALSNVEEVYSLLDDGLIGGTQHLVWALLKSAKESGVRIVLDGLDGDQVVGHGTQHLQQLAKEENWATLAWEIALLSQRFSEATHRHNFEDTFASTSKAFSVTVMKRLTELADEGARIRFFQNLRGARKHFTFKRRAVIKSLWKQLLIPRAVRELRARGRSDSESRYRLLRPDFAERTRIKDRVEKWEDQDIHAGNLRVAQAALISSGRLSKALETTDHYAAMLGVQIAHPFFDLRLVEFCLALPPSQSLKNGWTRFVMRQAMRGIVPDEVRCRSGKTWLGSSYERALFEIDRELLNTFLDDDASVWRYVSVDAVTEMRALGSSLPNEDQARLAKSAILSKWLGLRFMSTRSDVA